MCQAPSYGFAVPFFSQKGTGFLSHLETTRIYNGKTMPTLEISSKNYRLFKLPSNSLPRMGSIMQGRPHYQRSQNTESQVLQLLPLQRTPN